ncbi:hypothetical protein [Flavobacterium sp.]|uniref:hypothetical protein n=1 Tax=Flavobacterium sp. TaxID=239 RepID=UPI0040477F6D
MKKIKFLKTIIFIFILSTNYLFAQQKQNFNHLILTKVGNLNKDQILDSIVVKQDTIDICKPYRLEIYLTNKNEGKYLSISTDKAITPDCYKGIYGLECEKIFSDIEIIGDVFVIKQINANVKSEYSFQLRGKKFKLIKYNLVKSDTNGKVYYETINFNNNLRRIKAVNTLDNIILYDTEYRINFNSRYLNNFSLDPKH